MVNISHKTSTLRIAIAGAILKVSCQQTIDAILQRTVPKGDVFEFARAAGLLGVKKTSDLIPDCHPLPIEFTSISYEIIDLSVMITVEVHTVYKTGVEVEAMHGAAVTALTMYDMLKPIDKGIEIHSIRLLQKTGGKTDFNKEDYAHLKAAVVVCSDSISAGKGQDKSGKAIISALGTFGIQTPYYEIIPDDISAIQGMTLSLSKRVNLLIFTGGTGLSPRDFTNQAISPLLEKPVEGIMEAARAYGQQRTPYAMLSRSLAGLIGDTLVLTLPGSLKGVKESMDALFPQVLHIFKILKGEGH